MKKKDKELLYELQFRFPLTAHPYRELARRLKMTEEALITRIRELKRKKLIRYIGAVFNMNRLGYESTLVAMSVPPGEVTRVAALISSLPSVSHNYLRDDDRYNLWFTLTVPRGRIPGRIRKIKQMTGISDVLDLRSEQRIRIDTRFRL